MGDDTKRRWSLWQAIYEERSAAKAVATSVAGSVGLLTYSVRGDWAMGIWAVVVAFPVCWVAADPVRTRLLKWSQKRRQRQEMKSLFESLGDAERTVVEGFVHIGGCVLPYSGSYPRNDDQFPANGIESLMSRELLYATIAADGQHEIFVLDSELFDYARTVVRASF